MDTPSTKFSLNQADWVKIKKGLIITILGAVFTYVESIILSIDFGTYGPIVMIVNTMIVNVVKKWLAGEAIPDSTITINPTPEVITEQPQA